MRALLDTCTFIWLALDPDRISAAAAATINDASVELALSQVSVMEIVMKKTQKGSCRYVCNKHLELSFFLIS